MEEKDQKKEAENVGYAINRRNKNNSSPKKEIIFSKDNYIIIAIGLAIVIVGFFLMSGGTNAPDEWKAEEIYSFTRITLAPFVILAGLGVIIIAIFKSSGGSEIDNIIE